MKKIVVLSLLSLVFVGCNRKEKNSNMPVQVAVLNVIFDNRMNGKPIFTNDADRYRTENGDSITFSSFLYYISNIQLKNATGNIYAVPNSYHLVYATRDNHIFQFKIAVPQGTYQSISLGLGVDDSKNSSLDNVGDLDPSNEMAWDWNTGYKFIKLEGRIIENNQPLTNRSVVLHPGENRNYRTFSYNLGSLTLENGKETTISFLVQADELFKNPYLIDLKQKGSYMFGGEADTILTNAANGFISLK